MPIDIYHYQWGTPTSLAMQTESVVLVSADYMQANDAQPNGAKNTPLYPLSQLLQHCDLAHHHHNKCLPTRHLPGSHGP